MGLLNKLKNVLFEEEEIEDIKEEDVEIKKESNKPSVSRATMELPKINRETKKEKYNIEEENDLELFKAEKTFDFPAFDEEEFEDYTPKKKEEKVVKPYEYEKRERVNNSRKSEYTSTRVVKSIHENPKKSFKPSPVISPVYGILDKNYKKEDVVTRDEMIEKKNSKLDVDSVRKKAFGTLEEDLASTLSEQTEKNYQDDNFEKLEDFDMNLENLLDKTIDEEIDVTKEMEIPSRVSKINYEENDSEEIINPNKNKEVEDLIDEVPEVKEEQEEIIDDTLESDLFELIDSMYENREEEN